MMKPLIVAAALLLSLPAAAENAQHGLALHGAPKYGAGFKHFDYVNADAPKGGELHLSALGTYDTLNPFTLKGVVADGAGMVFETLMARSLDEPFTAYGWVAESVSVAADRSAVSYRLRPEATFHDGSPITVDDVIFSFETLRDKASLFIAAITKMSPKRKKPGNAKYAFRSRTHQIPNSR